MAKKDKKRRYGSARENAEKRGSGANYGYIKIPDKVKMFTPEADTTALIDILPYEVTDKHHMDKIEAETLWYKKPFKVHRYIGVNNDSFVCPTTFGKPCPICEHGTELRKESADEKLIDKTKAKYRNLYAIIVREYDGKKKFDKDTIHLFDFSDPLFQKVFETQLKRKKEFDNFFLHDEGCSLEITFDEDSFGGNKYAKVTRVDFVERKKQYKEEILDRIPNLDECLIQTPYDELEAIFFGESGVEDDDENDAPKGKKKNKKAKEDDDDDDVKPEKKKDKKKKKEEPEPDEDEEEDLTPPKKKKDKDKKKKKKVKDECPYNHTFGKDCDKFDDCEDCDLWNECKAAKKALKKNKD
jgi:hypothetical protein